MALLSSSPPMSCGCLPLAKINWKHTRKPERPSLEVYFLEHRTQYRRSEDGSGEISMYTPLSFPLNSEPMEKEVQETERQRFSV